MILIEANSINTNLIHSFLIFNNTNNMQREQRTSQLPERKRVEQTMFQKYFAHALPKKDNNTTINNDFNDTIKEVRNKILNPNASCVTAKNLPIKKANNSMKKKIATKKHLQLKKISLEEAKLRHKKDSEAILIEEVSSEEEEENDEDRAFIVSDVEELSEYEPEDIEDSDLDEDDLRFQVKEMAQKEKTDRLLLRYKDRKENLMKKEAETSRNTIAALRSELIQLQDRVANYREELNTCALNGLKVTFELESKTRKLQREKAKNKQLKKDMFLAITCMNESDESNIRRKQRAKDRERYFLDFLAFYSKNDIKESDLLVQYEKDNDLEWNEKPAGLIGASKCRIQDDDDLDNLAWSSDEEEPNQEEKSSQEY